jgi:glycerol-3-phosphate dehydrogenase (NAD+)
MWVYDEIINEKGEKLSESILHNRTNSKYLPNIILPNNLQICTDLIETCRGASVLVFVVPHQFLLPVLREIKASKG